MNRWKILGSWGLGMILACAPQPSMNLGGGGGGGDDDPSPDDDTPPEDGPCVAPPPPPEATMFLGENGGVILLPGGRVLTPSGIHSPLGGFPQDVVTHPLLPRAYITNKARYLYQLQVVDTFSGEVLQAVDREDAFYGLAMDEGGSHLYASAGDAGKVSAWELDEGGLVVFEGDVVIGDHVTGMDLSADGDTLYVAGFRSRSVIAVNTDTLEVTGSWPLSLSPWGVQQVPGSPLLVLTGFQGEGVAFFDTDAHVETGSLVAGGNPSALVASPDGSRVYLTASNSDEVLALEPSSETLVASVLLRNQDIIDEEGTPLGAISPNGICLDPLRNRLYVTRGADNAVTVIDAETLGILGSIPVGWYPTACAVSADGETLVVTNGKGEGTGPNTEAVEPSLLVRGTVSLVRPLEVDLGETTEQVLENLRRPSQVYSWRCDDTFPVPTALGGETPLEHIVLIVKENKTFDCLFSDLPDVAAEPDYFLFGEEITPNLHSLARTFSHHDNFYTDSEVSTQGHLWLTGNFVNEYMERSWIEDYAGSSGWAGDPVIPAAQPGFGNWFTHLLKHEIPFSVFGEVTGAFGAYDGQFVMEHVDLGFPGIFYDTDISDVDKAEYVASRLVDDGDFPAFSYVLLPNDHTHGTSPGALSPESMINDNDVAAGILVDRISHSPFWEKTAVFIVEDDPQQGADHIDAHRSICVVASPWAKRGHVSHVHTSFPSLFRSFGLILGIPPINRYDSQATPLWEVFTMTPDFTPYDSVERTVPDVYNSAAAMGAEESRRMDFRGPDRNAGLGDLLWRYRKGTEPPAGSVSDLWRGEAEEEEEDEEEEYQEAYEHWLEWLEQHPGVRQDGWRQ